MDTCAQCPPLLLAVALLCGCGDSASPSDTPEPNAPRPGVDAGLEPAGQPGGDAGQDGGPPAPPASAVPGTSDGEFATFLEQELHRQAPWQSQTETPRSRSHDVSPHGRVRVWRNDLLRASQQRGNGADLDAPQHDVGAMAVKEFYDDDDVLVGRAAMLKLDGDLRQWAYYCSGPDDRCADTAPIYGVGLDVSCGFCHGGLVFTHGN